MTYLTIEEKISHLQEAAMEEARAEGNRIMKQHETVLENIFEQHRAEAIRQSETRVKAEGVNAKQQLNMVMSKAQLELKRDLSKTRKTLKKELFVEVKEKLQEYMQTEEYKRMLVQYINPSDADKKEYLEEHTGMTLTVSREDFIGGVRAVIHGRNILIDHAYKGALENEYHNFMFRGGAGDE